MRSIYIGKEVILTMISIGREILLFVFTRLQAFIHATGGETPHCLKRAIIYLRGRERDRGMAD